CSSSLIHHPPPPMERGDPLHLRNRMRRQLVHDALAVGLDGAPRDEQLGRDLVVRIAADEELEDLALASGQPLERARPRTRELRVDGVARNAGGKIAQPAEYLPDRVDDLDSRLRLEREPARVGA